MKHRGRLDIGAPEWQGLDPDWPLSAHSVNITDHFWPRIEHPDTPNSLVLPRGAGYMGPWAPKAKYRPNIGQKQAKTQGWAHRGSKVVKSVFEDWTLKMVENHYFGQIG